MSGSRFEVDDIVYAEGASAILGDVIAVRVDDEHEYVSVRWRATDTVEDADDLVCVAKGGTA